LNLIALGLIRSVNHKFLSQELVEKQFNTMLEAKMEKLPLSTSKVNLIYFFLEQSNLMR